MNTILRAIVAAGIVGVLAIVAIVIWGPRTPSLSGSAAGVRPIAQPITPATFPYSQLAILRTQRLSIDVLPASVTKDRDKSFIETSARRIGRTGTETIWVVVDGRQETCVLFTSAHTDGYNSVCGTARNVAAGSYVTSGGEGDLWVSVMADGAVNRSQLHAGARQVAPGVWFSGKGELADRRPASTLADAQAMPLTEPYSKFEILRQPALPLSEVPKSFFSDDFYDELDLSTVRSAGTYKGARAWVAVSTEGRACFIVRGAEGSTGLGCDHDDEQGAGASIAGFANGGVIMILLTDGAPGADQLDSTDVKVGPNVWAGATT